MLSATAKRAAATVVVAGSVLVGVSAIPAAATPAQEAVYLAAMKQVWKTQPAKTQKTTCYAYRIAPKQLINQSVTASIADPDAAAALTRPAWKRVITDYLAWACSGPGTTPR
jgi:hypothetical protein